MSAPSTPTSLGGGAEDSSSKDASSSSSSSSSPSVISFVRFNQDCTSLALGSSSGYRLYTWNSVDQLDSIYAWPSRDFGKVIIVERLFSSSLLALVTEKEPRKLKVSQKNQEFNLFYSSIL